MEKLNTDGEYAIRALSESNLFEGSEKSETNCFTHSEPSARYVDSMTFEHSSLLTGSSPRFCFGRETVETGETVIETSNRIPNAMSFSAVTVTSSFMEADARGSDPQGVSDGDYR